MKKRVLSALLVLCMACSLVSTALATDGQATPETANEPAATSRSAGEMATPETSKEEGSSADPSTYPARTAEAKVDGTDATVQVDIPAGSLPEDATLTAALIGSSTDDAEAVADVAAELDEAQVDYDGFVALDISFKDAEGNEVEPNPDHPVTVRIELPDSIVNSGINLNTLAVSHLVEDEQGKVKAVEQVASVEDGGITLSDEAIVGANQAIGVSPMMAPAANNTLSGESSDAAVVAEFEVDTFSYFVLHYFIDLNALAVQMVDTEGNPIGNNESVGDVTLGGLSDWNPTMTIDEIRENLGTAAIIPGYTFKEAQVVTSGTNEETGEPYYETVVVKALGVNSLGSGISNWGWRYQDEDGVWHDMTVWNDMFGDESHTVYFVYTKDEPTEEPDAPTVTVPEHSKTATLSTDPQDAKGTYDLTLDVKGEINSSTSTMPLNLLLIIDKSGSMSDGMSDGKGGRTTKKQAVVDAVSKLTNTLESNQAVDVRYDVVMFSGANNSGTGTVVPWTSNVEAVNSAVNNFTPNGGTNYQHGIQQAIRDLTVETNGMIENGATCVIFLTDGVPTYRLWNGWQLGDGSYDDGGRNIAAAVSEISRMSVDYFYCIGTGNDFSDVNSQAVKNLQSLCNAVAATDTDWFRATNVNELNDAFDKIAGATTTLACNNVTVTDTLSQWVDAVEGKNPHIKVTRPGDDGSEVVVAEGDNSVTIPGNTDQNKESSYTITADYDSSTKQFKLTFPANYVLENGWTYSMTLKIQPNADAVADYEAKNKIYPNTGDDGTGSHANDSGYYSNASNAILSYKSVNDKTEDEATEAEYPMPVVQIDDSLLTPATASLTINKQVDDSLPNTVDLSKETYTFTVSGPASLIGETGITYGSENTPLTFELGTGANVDKAVSNVTVTGENSVTINGLPTGVGYTVTEGTVADIDTNTADGKLDYYPVPGQTTYQIDNGAGVTTPATIQNLAKDTTVTVTNTYKPYKTLTVEKIVTGEMGSSSDYFDFSATKLSEDGESQVDVTLVGAEAASDPTNYDFKLKSGSTVTIVNLKEGDEVTISEAANDNRGYTAKEPTLTALSDGVTAETQGNICVKVTVPGKSDTDLGKVTFNNVREAVAPTGLESNHTAPYTLMITAAGIAGLALIGSMMARRVRRRREE